MTLRVRVAMVCVTLLAFTSCTTHASIEEAGLPAAREDLSAGQSEPVTDSMYPEFGNADIDVLHYGLNLDYEPDAGRLSGSANLTIRAVHDASELGLDFSEAMTISRVTVDGEVAEYALQDWDLTIDTAVRAGQEINVNVVYSGSPRLVSAPAERPDMADGLGAAVDEQSGALWSFQEPYGALTWYPVNDHPSDEALYDFAITVPRGYSGVASGTFEGQRGDTFHWSSSDPVASYLTTIAVDEFEKLEMTGPDDLPIIAWIPPQFDNMRPVAQRMPEMLEYLVDRYGPYPFDSAGVVVVGGQSAMETQQMITFSGVMGDFGAESVMMHELAHQWFGNAVTPNDWSGLWLNEGPATYIEQMWNVDEGLTDTDLVVEEWRSQDALSRKESGPPGDADPQGFANTNSYVCPALMLYELRDELGGAAAVDAYLEAWVNQHNNQNVDRDDFVAFGNDYAGKDLTGFFDEWLDSPRTPESSP